MGCSGKWGWWTIVLAIVVVLPTSPLLAQAVAPEEQAWRFTVAPYAWLVGINGSVTAGGRSVDVNANFVDTLGKTDTLVGLMAYGEARKDKYTLYADFTYAQLAGSPGLAAAHNPLPGVSLSLAANGGATSTLVIADLGGMYEIWRQEGPGGSGSSIDALVGVRYWHAGNELAFNATAGFNAPGARLDRSGQFAGRHTGSMDWVDPLLGLQFRQRLAPQHEFRLRGDIGGFGLGSEFSWQLFAAYGYRFSSEASGWSALLGYRAMGVTYAQGSGSDRRGIDAVLHGPALGVAFRF